MTEIYEKYEAYTETIIHCVYTIRTILVTIHKRNFTQLTSKIKFGR